MGGEGQRSGRTIAGVLLLSVATAAAAEATLGALEIELSAPALERALRLARFPASDADRARFHQQYIFQVAGPTVENFRLESIEIITEFRRTELIAEEHARLNDLFGRSSLTEVRRALEPWRGRVYVAARVNLLNSGVTVGLPPLRVALDDLDPLGPAQVDNTYFDYALVGGVVAVPFEARQVGQSTRIATVMVRRRVLGGTRVDFRVLD